MLRVGLTGGAGSGKSTASLHLAEAGFPVLDADRIAHELYAPGTPLAEAIVREFGPAASHPAGGIDRTALGRLVFGDREGLQALNDLVHPPLLAEIERRFEDLAVIGERAAVLEAALLLQWAGRVSVDLVVGVWAPRELRLARLIAGGMTRETAQRRVDAQVSDQDLRAGVDILLENTGSRDAFRASVNALAGDLRRRAGLP